MRTFQVVATALGFSALSFTGGASADDYDPAEISFDRGVEHMEAGRFRQACPLIEESLRLDRRPGTLFTLAECEAKRGRIATAVALYDEYLKMYDALPPAKKATQGTRASDARAEKAELETQIPTLELTLPEGAPAGTVVKLNGSVVAASALGSAIEVDPGEHIVTTQAPGGPITEESVTLDRSDRKKLRLKVKGVAGKQAPTRLWQRPVAIATMSAGGVGLAVGAVLGVLAYNKSDESDVYRNTCSSPDPCSQGRELRGEAESLATGATAAFIAGGVFLAGGFVLFMTAPSTSGEPNAEQKPNAPSAPKAPKAEEKRAGARRPAWQAKLEIGPGSVHLKGAW
jgi:tetratricopeptide (TPR) repeat protein